MNAYKIVTTAAGREIPLGHIQTGISETDVCFGAGKLIYVIAENAMDAWKQFYEDAENCGYSAYLNSFTTTVKRATEEDVLNGIGFI